MAEMTIEQAASVAYITVHLGYREHKHRVTRNLSVPKVILDVEGRWHRVLRLIIEPNGEYHPPRRDVTQGPTFYPTITDARNSSESR